MTKLDKINAWLNRWTYLAAVIILSIGALVIWSEVVINTFWLIVNWRWW